VVYATITYLHRFECDVGGVHHPHHTQTGSIPSMIAADNSTV
jgi:hypothetical protein